VRLSAAQTAGSPISSGSALLALLVDIFIVKNATLQVHHETRKLYKNGGILPENATHVNFEAGVMSRKAG